MVNIKFKQFDQIFQKCEKRNYLMAYLIVWHSNVCLSSQWNLPEQYYNQMFKSRKTAVAFGQLFKSLALPVLFWANKHTHTYTYSHTQKKKKKRKQSSPTLAEMQQTKPNMTSHHLDCSSNFTSSVRSLALECYKPNVQEATEIRPNK